MTECRTHASHTMNVHRVRDGITSAFRLLHVQKALTLRHILSRNELQCGVTNVGAAAGQEPFLP